MRALVVAYQERRSSLRLPIEIDVEVEGAAQRFRSTTVDVSPSGMFVMTHADIPVGTHVMLAFTLPSGVSLQVIGVVQWRREKHAATGEQPGLGIAFFCLDPEVKKMLESFCAVRAPLYTGAPPPSASSPPPATSAFALESGEFEVSTVEPKGD